MDIEFFGAALAVDTCSLEDLWRDDVGVTCRRWNWRQCVRTRLAATTTDVLFILDGLDPVDADRLHAAGDALVHHLRADSSAVEVSWRLLG